MPHNLITRIHINILSINDYIYCIHNIYINTLYLTYNGAIFVAIINYDILSFYCCSLPINLMTESEH